MAFGLTTLYHHSLIWGVRVKVRLLCSQGWSQIAYVAKHNFQYLIPLLLSATCWDYRSALPCLICVVLIELRASCTLGKQATDSAPLYLFELENKRKHGVLETANECRPISLITPEHFYCSPGAQAPL